MLPANLTPDRLYKVFALLILAFLVGFFLTMTQTNLLRTSVFQDIPVNPEMREAIEGLAENYILRGYSDGTVRPENPLSRAEFATLLHRSITEDNGGTVGGENAAYSGCFSDIGSGHWYEEPICYLASLQIFKGYGDGTFKPGEDINRADAVVSMCRFFEWEAEAPLLNPYADVSRTSYYGACVAYAKEHGVLGKIWKNLKQFNPSGTMTRGDVSVLLWNSLALQRESTGGEPLRGAAPSETSETETAPEELEEAFPAFTPVAPEFTDTDFFVDAMLDSKLPNTFYRNEVYFFEGTISTSDEVSDAFVFLIPKDNKDAEHLNFVTKISNGRFSIPLHFMKPGNYQLGFIIGIKGSSKIVSISVLNETPAGDASQLTETKPSAVTLAYQDAKISASWEGAANTITRLTFSQGTRQKQFLMRQNKKRLTLRYNDFAGLSEGETHFDVAQARIISAADSLLRADSPLITHAQFSEATTLSFRALEHSFREIANTATIIKLNEMLAAPGLLQFEGRVAEKVSSSGAITLPSGFVEDFAVHGESSNGEKEIAENANISYSRNLTAEGRYIFEINDVFGGAVINIPIYVGNVIPLIPDYFDLTSTAPSTEPLDDLDALQQEMLALVNDARTAHGLSPIVLDETLNGISQAHTEDMVAKDYFAHVNKEGKSPDDRRLSAVIPTPVQENLAKAPFVRFAHEGLMRSPVHRKNIVDSAVTRVGFGFAKDEKGNLLVTQEFSVDALDAEDMIKIRNQLYDHIQTYRESRNLGRMATDGQLETVADAWSKKMVADDFFSFTAPDGSTLIGNVRAAGVTGKIQAYILENGKPDALKTELGKNEPLSFTSLKTAGIGIEITELGILRLTVVYSY